MKINALFCNIEKKLIGNQKMKKMARRLP